MASIRGKNTKPEIMV
ncbi:MAG: very short patch repair endonuclease, partial [Prevotella sp.]|nr:very short patch repair endonuclease [Prevotella sp.]